MNPLIGFVETGEFLAWSKLVRSWLIHWVSHSNTAIIVIIIIIIIIISSSSSSSSSSRLMRDDNDTNLVSVSGVGGCQQWLLIYTARTHAHTHTHTHTMTPLVLSDFFVNKTRSVDLLHTWCLSVHCVQSVWMWRRALSLHD